MMTTAERLPYLNTRETAPFRFLGIPSLMRATAESTNGAFGLIEHWDMPPGFASPYHTHHREDESFYVLEGEMAFVCGGKWLKAGPGSFVYGPRLVAHGFKVIGNAPARMLLMCTPGGFERFVLEQTTPMAEPPSPPDMVRLVTLAASFEIDIHGPLPEEPSDWNAGISPSAGAGNKALGHRWIEAFNKRDWTTERALRRSDFKAHLAGNPEAMDHAAWSEFMTSFTTAFPDSQATVESILTEGDQVASRFTITGTHRGEFMGIPPTGRGIRFDGIEINRLADGKFVEHWAILDNVTLLRQIGAMPA